MLSVLAVLALVGAGIVVLLYQGIAILFAYQMPRIVPSDAAKRGGLPARYPISVVIAARNEAEDLPATLDDLLAQDAPPEEIVVVDGGSTDGTAAVVGSRAPQVLRIEEPPLPPGWIGKSWACATGAAATRGEWILFLDADVRTDPRALGTALAWARSEGADLASVGSRIEMGSFWERVVLPFYVQMILVHLRAPRVGRPDSSSAMANGQFLLVRRATYEKVGGHASVHDAILEDVALAQRFRLIGARLSLAWGPEIARTRMYRDRSEMFDGLLKTVHGVEYSALVQLGRLVGLLGLFLLPLGLLPLGLVEGSRVLVGLGTALWIALFGKHVAFARAVGAPAAYGLLYPLSVAYYAALLGTSIARGLGDRPLRWKGRSYPLRR